MLQIFAPWKTCLPVATWPSSHRKHSLAWMPLVHIGVCCRTWLSRYQTNPVSNLFKVMTIYRVHQGYCHQDSVQQGALHLVCFSARHSAAHPPLLPVLLWGLLSANLPQTKDRGLLYQCVFCKLLLVTMVTTWPPLLLSYPLQNRRAHRKMKCVFSLK